ncbi:hypothetical protein CUB89_06600 [Akkermansia muciniphila]|nr:hypothetical protein CUB89_06600 [Akkermansia muciniphila]
MFQGKPKRAFTEQSRFYAPLHRFPKNGINKERSDTHRRPEFFLLLCPHAGGDIRIPGKQDFFSKKILPRPENLIYFSAHGRRKAPIF